MQNQNITVLFNSEYSETPLELIRADGTLWGSQKQIADIFGIHPKTVSQHIGKLIDNGKINTNSDTRSYKITATDGKTYNVLHYNLHVIIQIGFMSNSPQASEFVVFATGVITSFEVDGFVVNKPLLENSEIHSNAFDQTARDIRASDKEVSKRLTAIIAHYSTDYDAGSEIATRIFQLFTNKIHYAASGLTAAGLIMRADATKPNMGLVTYNGVSITTADIPIGKNYLTKLELEISKSVKIMYLEQCNIVILTGNKIPMAEWLVRLENCIKICGLNILVGYGFVNTADAKNHALEQYAKFNPKYKPRKKKKLK